MKARRERVLNVVLCVLVLVFVFSVCGGAAIGAVKVPPKAGGEKYKIGLAMNELVIAFYMTIDARLNKLCGERGWEYVMLDAQGDINKQISNMEDLVSQQCDMILINSFDTETLTNAINSITAGGTPIIAIDNSLEPAANVLTTVQADNRGISRAVGEWLGEKMGKTPIKALLISGAIGASNSTERRLGMIEGVMEAQLRNNSKTDFQIIAHGFTDWKEDQAVTLMEDMLALNQEFNVLMTEVDYEAIAAKKIMDEAGRGDGVIVVAAADGAKEALELIKQGQYGATGLNLPGLIADYTIEVCEKYFAGEKNFPERVFTPAACVNTSNVEQYYDPDSLF